MDISDVERLGHGNTSSCRGRFRSGKIQSFQDCSRGWRKHRRQRIQSQLRWAGVHEWLQVQPLGPPCRSRSSLPQSSTATLCTSVARGVLKKIGFSWRRLQVSVFNATPLCILPVWFRQWRCWADDVPALFILVSVMAMTVPKSAPTMALTMITTAARCVRVAKLLFQRNVRTSLPKRFLVPRARPGDDFFAG